MRSKGFDVSLLFLAFLVILSLLVGCSPYRTLAMEFSSLAVGKGAVFEAAKYVPYDAGPHRILLLDSAGNPHKWNNKLPDEWLPTQINETELVALIDVEREIKLGTQRYIGGPPVTRYRFEMQIKILEARTGKLLWSGTLKGSEPPGFPQTAQSSQTKLQGSHISSVELVEWLSCKVEPQNCEMFILESSLYTNSWSSIAVSPDGQTLAAVPATAEGVFIWRLADGVLLFALGTDPMESVVFSPDGGTLAGLSEEGILYLWNMEDVRQSRSIERPVKDESCSLPSPRLVFSSDGQSLSVVSSCGVEVWDLSDGSLLGTTTFPSSFVGVSAVSEGGQFLVVKTAELKTMFYRVSDGELFSGPKLEGLWLGLVFSPDGSRLAVGEMGSHNVSVVRDIVKLWQISDNTLLQTFTLEHVDGAGSNISIALSPDGQFLATRQSKGRLELWKTDYVYQPVITLGEPGSLREVSTTPVLVFSPDSQLLAFTDGSGDGIIYVLRIQKVAE